MEAKLKILATRCGSCGCGCPTIFESDDKENLVIVGSIGTEILNSPIVRQHVGEGEIAVVIPKSLLLEASKALV
jgi:hypothetical protein